MYKTDKQQIYCTVQEIKNSIVQWFLMEYSL